MGKLFLLHSGRQHSRPNLLFFEIFRIENVGPGDLSLLGVLPK
jgi:hypothetical protein